MCYVNHNGGKYVEKWQRLINALSFRVPLAIHAPDVRSLTIPNRPVSRQTSLSADTSQLQLTQISGQIQFAKAAAEHDPALPGKRRHGPVGGPREPDRELPARSGLESRLTLRETPDREQNGRRNRPRAARQRLSLHATLIGPISEASIR